MIVYTPVGPGELIEKIAILEIKSERVAPRDKLADKLSNVRAELAELVGVRDALWWVEDELRDHERHADFGPSFVALARSVYRLNDQRAALKRRINQLLSAAIVEEKFHAAY
jgi:hypothetical protein